MKGIKVLTHFSLANKIKVGMKVTMPGSNITARQIVNTASLPGQRMRAKLNATIAEIKTSPNMGIKVVIRELTKNFPNGATASASGKFSQRMGLGIQTGGLIYTWEGLFNAVLTNQNKGTINGMLKIKMMI